ncbi:hypothetical protein BDN71DRAFT_547898 [Pleurotus eryngii]|uniref:Uncharacterized protein n=1 Tax=Pleurotus eryngii TaxID=5323 RepID=A0A9P6D9S3_PLEER|nr:hypothetical protein BDN71DRAFT_547898 [Pleurotus eryngii]
MSSSSQDQLTRDSYGSLATSCEPYGHERDVLIASMATVHPSGSLGYRSLTLRYRMTYSHSGFVLMDDTFILSSCAPQSGGLMCSRRITAKYTPNFPLSLNISHCYCRSSELFGDDWHGELSSPLKQYRSSCLMRSILAPLLVRLSCSSYPVVCCTWPD